MTAVLARTDQPAGTSAPAANRVATNRVVLRPAPRREPPFDDELPTAGTGTAVGASRAGHYEPRLPFAPVARPRVWRPAAAAHTPLPDPAPWGHRLLVGMIETAGGRRPLRQLAALVSPSVARGLGGDFERAALHGRHHWLHRANVRSVRASQPGDGVVELAATLDVGDRVRAVALRLEVHHGRWRCVRLQLG
jgi:hypothetical protein